VSVANLKEMRSLIGSQCSLRRPGEMWSKRLVVGVRTD